MAQAIFWSIANKPKVIGVLADKTGLRISDGKTVRTISWYIASLKVKNNELRFDGDERARLKAKLAQLGIGKQLIPLL